MYIIFLQKINRLNVQVENYLPKTTFHNFNIPTYVMNEGFISMSFPEKMGRKLFILQVL